MIHAHNILMLPGWGNSGPAHWQSLWAQHYGYSRVEQHDWDRPLRGDWVTRLEDAIRQSNGPCVLVAHSLACHLVTAWAALSPNPRKVHAALLVAPPDLQRDELSAPLHSWVRPDRLARPSLPFKSLLVASRDDPHCAAVLARQFATAWGSEFVDAGALGHINTASHLGDWPAGHALLTALCAQPVSEPHFPKKGTTTSW